MGLSALRVPSTPEQSTLPLKQPLPHTHNYKVGKNIEFVLAFSVQDPPSLHFSIGQIWAS